ncbi:MAG: Nicotinamide phosphoribosyltransferase (EC [uncultured Sulfurovum sp.]|uniref:Nicotinamide phosphoribosyltransferase n=1 Tax=uncultured Sulfurovum sp. TaxID=269237 RepID=A0A6S6TU09_9BACT|nr:MAG: Nicotinamide phosphoribosyltransferase (EC [uncultured Sulfurovum sp.]
MNTKNIILNTDSYKSSHYLQYPPKSEYVSSYIEARGGDYPKTLFFGLQAFIKEYLLTPITQEDIDEAKAIITAHGLPFNEEGWQYILDEYEGYLPIEISAVKEGMLIPLKCPLVQVINTDKKVPWLTSYMETALLRAIWFPTTVATLSYSIKEIIRNYLEETSDNVEAELPFKLHDFGARGTSSEESAMLGGMAHLVNFQGTDNLSGVMGARRYYGAEMAGFSIPASEHSTMTSWQREGESDAYANMVKQFGGEGKIFAVVSDSYDIYNAVSNIWGKELKEQVKQSGATLVIRPDSGEPKEIVLEVMKRVYKTFGGYKNSKGYIVLDDSVRIIQGDGVDKEAIKEILEVLKNEGFSADNIAFGMGGGLLQEPNRDDFRFAMKASAICVDGEWRDVYKDPVTDSGKRSKRGRLGLTKDFETVRVEELGDRENLLVPVFRNGKLLKEFGFDEVRRCHL